MEALKKKKKRNMKILAGREALKKTRIETLSATRPSECCD